MTLKKKKGTLAKGSSINITKKVKGENVIQFESGEQLDPVRLKEFVPQAGMTVAGIAKGLTVNLGNFESARVDAWVIRNVPNDDLNDTIADMAKFVEDLVSEELTQLAKEMKNRK